MKEILTAIISVVSTAIIIPLISIIGDRIIAYLNAKTESQKLALNISTATNIVMNVVRAVYQTFVDNLKKEGVFDKEAQAVALEKAKELIRSQISFELTDIITKAYGDFEVWLETQIEASLNMLKDGK